MPKPVSRLLELVLAGIAGAAVAAAVVTLAPTFGTDRGDAAASAAGALDERMRELQIIPLAGQRPHPFTLPGLDGKRVALADLKGKAALLYFWATW
jgi:cytochrome oxidase Cu insertion factor (SCO1/SenC/PrrC family)